MMHNIIWLYYYKQAKAGHVTIWTRYIGAGLPSSGIEDAEDIANDIIDTLTEDDAKAVRARVGENLQSRLENGDINAISQFADYHLTILDEPDYGTAYIWYSIAVALNIPDTIDRRDDTESDIEAKDLARLQTEARDLFEKYNFAPFNPKETGGANES